MKSDGALFCTYLDINECFLFGRPLYKLFRFYEQHFHARVLVKQYSVIWKRRKKHWTAADTDSLAASKANLQIPCARCCENPNFIWKHKEYKILFSIFYSLLFTNIMQSSYKLKYNYYEAFNYIKMRLIYFNCIFVVSSAI